MSRTRQLLPYKWVEGAGANRPQLPSEAREEARSTRQLLPWARTRSAESQRVKVLPWRSLTMNDWRGAADQ